MNHADPHTPDAPAGPAQQPGGAFASLHRREDGAVLLMALAGVLILTVMGMMIYDVGLATKEKSETQAATDFAALTQASVKARSMNMISYGNIAKRSIWAVHSLYPAHIDAFRDWLFDGLSEYCQWEDSGTKRSDDSQRYYQLWGQKGDAGDVGEDRCQAMINHLRYFEMDTTALDRGEWEERGDFVVFTGYDEDYNYGDAGEFYVNGSPEDILPREGGSHRYHYYDLMAIDNHQRYVAGATAWWAWTEKLMTGLRNGVTLTASSPAPPGVADNQPGTTVGAYPADRLPVDPPDETDIGNMRSYLHDTIDDADLEQLYDQTGLGNIEDPFVAEHIVNNVMFRYRSTGVIPELYDCGLQGQCEVGEVLGGGAADVTGLLWDQMADEAFRTTGLEYSEEAFSMHGPAAVAEPWSLDTSGNWGAKSSNFVFGYMDDHRDNRGVTSRSKYIPFGEDTEDVAHLQGSMTGGTINLQEAVGYFGMARSEVLFADENTNIEQPDLFHPAWTARLRPVSLPDEEVDISDMHREVERTQQMVAQLSQIGVHVTEFEGVLADDEYRADFARLEWMLRALDDTTAGGVVK